MASKIKFLVNSRKYTRKLVTECYNKKDTISSLPDVEKNELKAQLNDYCVNLKDLNEKIQEAKWQEEESESWLNDELKNCEDYFRKIRECLVLTDRKARSVSDVETARSLLRSPTAPLPIYTSQENEDLLKFFIDFEEITSMFNYSNYDKFILLKQQVSGRALILINSLESDKRGYDHAKTLLIEALASEDTRIFSVIKQLSEMKLDYGNDPFDYISKMKNISESVNKLNLNADSFLRYFFWKGLNDDFKGHMTQITNSSKPTLKEIQLNFFEASDRYVMSQKLRKNMKFEKKATSVAAAEVYDNSSIGNVQFKPCSLCTKMEGKDADHPIFKCNKFATAKEKIDKINNLKGCLKCANLGHFSSACKFRFRSKCRFCKEWHFSFLCLKGEYRKPKDSGTKKSKSEGTASSIAITEALRSNVSNDSSILPTFSCTLETGLKIRALKDGGCQSNFVSENIVLSQNLKVLKDNISMNINGINTTKEYITKLIEVPLYIGKTKVTLEALMIPSINIKLNLPGLSKLVRCIKQKGYEFCDEYLLDYKDNIDNLDFILGTKNSYCLAERDIVFGNEGKSVLSQTASGILLKGDIKTLIEDLDYLQVSPEIVNVQSAGIENLHNSTSDKHSLESLGVSFENNSFFSSIGNVYPIPVSECFNVINENGNLVQSQLEKASNEILKNYCEFYTNYDKEVYDLDNVELNQQLVKYVLDNTTRNEQGRLVMPLMWNAKISHLLGKNMHLSRLILQSNLKKWQKNKEQLQLMDDTIKGQVREGIIERIDNLEPFLKDHPTYSFLPLMGVFRMDRETTKCRIVFLSNLCEKNSSKSLTVSHNQAIHPGPCLNQKLGSAILHLRFDEKLLCFDLCKAFNQIALQDIDTYRLLFLWYRNVAKGDFSLVGYRNVRLSFGLRCSPTILLLGLYKLLILDAKNDPSRIQQLKKLIYSLCYMDNCAVSAANTSDLRWAYLQLESVFSPYQFSLQQFATNAQSLQNEIDKVSGNTTPSSTKLLGLQWDRVGDSLSTKKVELDSNASSKREILSSIASQFDLFGYNGPILNRSRIFLHELQCNKNLGWDEKLSEGHLKEWQNIVRQANAAPEITVKRCVGKRSGSFKLIAFADSSKIMFGVVIYILDLETSELSFLVGKNRIVNKQLESKSIPSLELNGIDLAAQCLMDLFKELSGPSCINPINIVELEIYSDSLVALTWLNSHSIRLCKMQKQSVFVLNRLNHISAICEVHPVKFSFISGVENPADAITRSCSYYKLSQTNYFPGPDFLKNITTPELSRQDTLSFVIPNPHSVPCNFELENVSAASGINIGNITGEHIDKGENPLPLDKFSSFHKLVSVYCNVLKFIHGFKLKVKRLNPTKFAYLDTDDCNFYAKACRMIILRDQQNQFPELFEYFNCKHKSKKNLPNLVGQLNVYMDQEGLLRVRSKCDRIGTNNYNFPLLLAKKSKLTRLIILDLHKKKAHAGCYSLLAEMRKRFYVPHFFSVVKKILRDCVGCRRFRERTIKLNQSPYREWRINPPNIPYRYIFMDHLGPLWVKQNDKKVKVWLLCVTCMWSRAVNLKLCSDLSVREFLRAFQLHTFEHGLPEYCISDLGSQFVAAANIIHDYLHDHETQSYFQENGVKPLKFDQFAKGHSELGSMVEVCVKMTKRLLFGAIGKNVLDIRDFEFLIAQTIHLINRRPVAFKESLREAELDKAPEPITPEGLIRGYDLISVNVIPELHADPELSWDPQKLTDLRTSYEKLKRVRLKLADLYHNEFIGNLIYQAVNLKDRYKPVSHKNINKGDIVLLKEQNLKPSHYPLGLIKNVERNVNGEVTAATILKGNTRELVRRHSSVIIPLLALSPEEEVEEKGCDAQLKMPIKENKERRKAAIVGEQKTKDMLRQ